MTIKFYSTSSGREVVMEFLDSLPRKLKAKAFQEIDLLAEYGTKLKEPYVKHIDKDLWELRIQFSSDIARIFYFVMQKDQIILLHGFVKKTNKTPTSEIATARKRMQDYKERCTL